MARYGILDVIFIKPPACHLICEMLIKSECSLSSAELKKVTVSSRVTSHPARPLAASPPKLAFPNKSWTKGRRVRLPSRRRPRARDCDESSKKACQNNKAIPAAGLAQERPSRSCHLINLRRQTYQDPCYRDGRHHSHFSIPATSNGSSSPSETDAFMSPRRLWRRHR